MTFMTRYGTSVFIVALGLIYNLPECKAKGERKMTNILLEPNYWYGYIDRVIA